MEQEDIRNIAKHRTAIELANMMLEDLESTYSSLGNLGNKVSSNQAPDSALIHLCAQRDSLRAQLQQDYKRHGDEMQKCLDAFKKIGDARLRKILYFRYVKNYRWSEIAENIGYPATADSCKKSAERYFLKCREEALRARPV